MNDPLGLSSPTTRRPGAGAVTVDEQILQAMRGPSGGPSPFMPIPSLQQRAEQSVEHLGYLDLRESMGAEKWDFDPVYEGIIASPEFKKVMELADDPEEELAKAYSISALAKLYNLSFGTVTQNYDELRSVTFGPGMNPRSEAQQISNAKSVGEYFLEQGLLSYKWMMGTASDEDLERIRYLDAAMPQVQTQFKDIPLAFKTTFLQSWPMMREAAMAGNAQALATGATTGAMKAFTAAGDPSGMSVSAAIGFLQGFGASKAYSAYQTVAELESGLLFKRIMDLTGENGEKIPVEIARKYAATGGAAAAAVEALELESIGIGIFGKGTVGTLKAGFSAGKALLGGKDLGAAFLDALKGYVSIIGKETGEEVSQNLIEDFYTELAIKNSGNPDAFAGSKRTPKEVRKEYLETALSSAILAGGLGIAPTVAKFVGGRVEVQAGVRNAVREAVVEAMEENRPVADIMDRLSRDPRVGGLSESRVSRMVGIKANGLELLNAMKYGTLEPTLDELYQKDAQKSYDETVKNWTRETPPPSFEEYFDGYMAAIGKHVPPAAFSVERTGMMYDALRRTMEQDGRTKEEIDDALGSRNDYHERVTAPTRAFDAAMTTEGRAHFLRQMADTVTELEKMSQEIRTGNKDIDDSVTRMIQEMKAETSVSAYGLTEGEALATQTEIIRGRIAKYQEEAQRIKNRMISQRDFQSPDFKRATNAFMAVGERIVALEELLLDPDAVLRDAGWTNTSLGHEVNTVKDITLKEKAKIDSFLEKIEKIQNARAAMKRVPEALREQSEREIRVLKDAIRNAERRIEDYNKLLLNSHRRKYIEFEKNSLLEERSNRIVELYQLLKNPEFQKLITEGNFEEISKRPGFEEFTPRELYDVTYQHAQAMKAIETNKTTGYNRAKAALGTSMKDEYERILQGISGFESKNIPEIRAAQIEALKTLVRGNQVNDAVVSYVLSQVNEALESLGSSDHPATREDLVNMIPSFVNELNLAAFNGSDSGVEPMSIQQLSKLYRMIQYIRELGAREMAMKTSEAKLEAEVITASVVDHMTGKKNIGDFKKFVKAAQGTVAHPVDFFRTFGGDSMVETFVKKKLNQKNLEEIQKIRRAEKMAEAIKASGVNKVKNLYKDRIINGQKFTTQELMGIYIGMQNPYTAEVIKQGTFANGMKIPEAVYENILDHLSPGELRVADAIQLDFQDAWERLAAAHEKSTGQRLGRQKVYMPMVWEYLEFDNVQDELLSSFMYGSDQKFLGVYNKNLEERVQKQIDSRSGIKLGLFDLWSDMLHKQEHYIASVENVEVMKRILQDPTLARKANEVYGHAVLQQAKKYVENYASPSSIYGNSFIDKTVRFLRNNLGFANLAFVLPIMVRQSFSGPFYMMYSGAGNYFSAMGKFIKNPIETMNWVKEVAPAVISSGTGFELTKTKPSTYSGLKAKIGEHEIYLKEVQKIFNDIGMGGINFFDKVTKAVGFVAVYDHFVEDLGHEGAVREALYVTDLTQPTNDKTALPDIYRHNALLDTLLMYTQQPMKILNMMTSEMGQKAFESQTDPSAVVNMILGSAAIALSTMGIWVLKNRRAPEDERELLEIFATSFISDIPLVGRELVNGYNGYSSGSQLYDPLRAVAYLATDKSFEKKVKAVIDGLAVSTGMIPTNAIDKIQKAIDDEDILDILIGVKPK